MALLIVGWLPLGVHSTVAEGHNDAVMIALALVWALGMRSRQWAGPLALAASALCKYVTAPLAIVDALYHLRKRTMPLAAYLLRGAPRWRWRLRRAPSHFGERINATVEMRHWRFLEPADLFRALERLFGVDIPGTGLLFS